MIQIINIIQIILATVAFTLSVIVTFYFRGSPYGKAMLTLSFFIFFLISHYFLDIIDYTLVSEISEFLAFIFLFNTGAQISKGFII